MPFPVEIVGSRQDLSDWIVVGAAVVQAVGSVAAIIAAVLISRHDRLEGQRLAALGRVTALAAIMSKSEDSIRVPYNSLSVEGGAAFGRVFGAPYQDNLRKLDRCLTLLRAVPAHELGSWELASAVVEMEEALTTGKEALETIRVENPGLAVYPHNDDDLDLAQLVDPVNLAAEALARVHQASHRLSKSPRARRFQITPAYVGVLSDSDI
jgi:hypothetical protein